MTSLVEQCKHTFLNAVEGAEQRQEPYQHWILRSCLPDDILRTLQTLPLPAPDLGGVSGTREVHNATRAYVDVENRKRFPACAALAETLQDPTVVRAIAQRFGTVLDGSYLRIEYTQDTDGFWLEPHTDIGVKRFTLLCYLSDNPAHEKLGTDIYADADTWVTTSPFAPNTALVFIPSEHTWHGFRPRKIDGVRKSIIINYVTEDWRAREQLCFPEETVLAAQAESS